MADKIEPARVPKWSFGEAFREESAPATDRCKEPWRWTMMDEATPEIEVLKFLASLVKLVKPEVVLSVGDVTGYASLYMAQACRENGFGIVHVLDGTEKIGQLLLKSGLEGWVGFIDPHSTPKKATIAFMDAESDVRSLVENGCLFVKHDGDKSKANGSTVYLPTPRGLTIFQQ